MSRWLFAGRRTVEQTWTIDIGTITRAGYVGKPAGNWWVWRDKAYVLNIRPKTWRDGWLRLDNQTLQTEAVPSRFGGQRFYFRCNCGRRVEKLHSTRGGLWRCRHCYDLTYATRQATTRGRYLIKAQKIRERLGGRPSLLEEFPPKPKGMHWKRYERLRMRHDAAEKQFCGVTAAWLYRLGGRPLPS